MNQQNNNYLNCRHCAVSDSVPGIVKVLKCFWKASWYVPLASSQPGIRQRNFGTAAEKTEIKGLHIHDFHY